MVNSISGLSDGFWGEVMAVVRLPNPKRKTLGERGIDCIFVGYAEHSKAYRPKDNIPNSDESQKDDHSNDVPSETPEPRKGKRARKAKSYDSNFQLYLVEGSRDLGYQYSYSIEEDPKTYNEAIQSRDVAFWKEATNDEIGFRQKEGIYYFDTYASVARITTIRLLLALAAIYNLLIYQMDVKTAFLNGDLKEVYMKQPEGFVLPDNEHKVCKLIKSLYGLKQAPKQWHQKFDEVVLCSGFVLNQSEKYVILGIKIKRENRGIVITQSHYIEKILKKFNREDCSSVSTPMDPVEKLMPNTVNHVEDSSSISTSGWVFLLGRGAISWASKKQTCITDSTIEYEFVALDAAGKEAEWL
ncbi:zinc finger, CCHC-type containing protein [Tanacetum coccineum]